MKRDNQVDNDDDDYTTEFRQYDSDLGRWLSVDPLMDLGAGLSPYNFNFNDPINFTDIEGLWPNGGGGPGQCSSCGGKPKVKNTKGKANAGDNKKNVNAKLTNTTKTLQVIEKKQAVQASNVNKQNKATITEYKPGVIHQLSNSKRAIDDSEDGGVVGTFARFVINVGMAPYYLAGDIYTGWTKEEDIDGNYQSRGETFVKTALVVAPLIKKISSVKILSRNRLPFKKYADMTDSPLLVFLALQPPLLCLFDQQQKQPSR